MAKRGESRPWRVRFEWLSAGVTGTSTHPTEDRLELAVEELRRTAVRRESLLHLEYGHRDGRTRSERVDGAELAERQEATTV